LIKTLGELKASGYRSMSIKEEIRQNLVKRLKSGQQTFEGMIGYEDSVIPETERALLSRHNILFLGLRGQAKTRMARQMVHLLDEYIPVVAGSEVNDDPLQPVSTYAQNLILQKGDDTPVEWLKREARYGEKLATPDVSVADLIGDIDPIKAANQRLSFSHEEAIHYGMIPRCNRCIFVINELPDLQARIQVALFNILEEGDVQIRGFKIRLPLDVMFVFTANPEDYTNRGSIVTPLKDRIQSQILTHYPKTIDQALQITEQEAQITPEQSSKVEVSDVVKRLIEQIAFEARTSEYVDKKSGVSARMSIAAYENLVSTAERRCILFKEPSTQAWVSDLAGAIPAITGKIELVYEGEQEGPYQVAVHLLDKSIRAIYGQYFPAPEKTRKKRSTKTDAPVQHAPYQAILNWFENGNSIDLYVDMKDQARIQALYKVDGLYAYVTKYFKNADEWQGALLMELVLYGLAAHSLISKRIIERKTKFEDIMNGMMDQLDKLSQSDPEDE
jgi:magnesium chelatase subunit I